ncbi:MAG: hypothetical protein WBA12_10220 [Catalinimonas sp.]
MPSVRPQLPLAPPTPFGKRRPLTWFDAKKDDWYDDNQAREGEEIKPDDTAEEINRKTGNKPDNDVYRKSDRSTSSDADELYEANKDIKPYTAEDQSEAERRDEAEENPKPDGLKYRSQDMQ